ncbi:MAG: hypothetical protein ACTS8H_02070 [Arsenophonus sp. NC-PE1-MAG3]
MAFYLFHDKENVLRAPIIWLLADGLEYLRNYMRVYWQSADAYQLGQ